MFCQVSFSHDSQGALKTPLMFPRRERAAQRLGLRLDLAEFLLVRDGLLQRGLLFGDGVVLRYALISWARSQGRFVSGTQRKERHEVTPRVGLEGTCTRPR